MEIKYFSTKNTYFVRSSRTQLSKFLAAVLPTWINKRISQNLNIFKAFSFFFRTNCRSAESCLLMWIRCFDEYDRACSLCTDKSTDKRFPWSHSSSYISPIFWFRYIVTTYEIAMMITTSKFAKLLLFHYRLDQRNSWPLKWLIYLWASVKAATIKDVICGQWGLLPTFFSLAIHHFLATAKRNAAGIGVKIAKDAKNYSLSPFAKVR